MLDALSALLSGLRDLVATTAVLTLRPVRTTVERALYEESSRKAWVYFLGGLGLIWTSSPIFLHYYINAIGNTPSDQHPAASLFVGPLYSLCLIVSTFLFHIALCVIARRRLRFYLTMYPSLLLGGYLATVAAFLALSVATLIEVTDMRLFIGRIWRVSPDSPIRAAVAVRVMEILLYVGVTWVFVSIVPYWRAIARLHSMSVLRVSIAWLAWIPLFYVATFYLLSPLGEVLSFQGD